MSDWLELELAHRLTPVEAPPELWERVLRARVECGMAAKAAAPVRRQTAAPVSWWRAWPLAAMAGLALAVAACWLVDLRAPVLDIQQLAAAGLWRSAALKLESHDPRAIRLWLRQYAGVDVPLPASTAVQLAGARVVRQGNGRVAAVEYRVGADRITLLVARADPRHPLPPHGRHASAWQAHDQVYTVAGASPDRVEAACQLCHASL